MWTYQHPCPCSPDVSDLLYNIYFLCQIEIQCLDSVLWRQSLSRWPDIFCIREIVELCAIISERGEADETGRRSILFGDLFNAYRWEYQCRFQSRSSQYYWTCKQSHDDTNGKCWLQEPPPRKHPVRCRLVMVSLAPLVVCQKYFQILRSQSCRVLVWPGYLLLVRAWNEGRLRECSQRYHNYGDGPLLVESTYYAKQTSTHIK